jgi:uncharacterized protein with PIN domain
MGLLEDIMKTLERVPGWKRIASGPDELDALKRRVEALEAKLAPATGEQCPICKERSLSVIASAPHRHLGPAGMIADTYRCHTCGHTEERTRQG